MTGYRLVNLKLLIEEAGEDKAKKLLSGYSCPLNEDVESFAKQKAIEFAKQGLAQTHLVFASFRESPVLVGYFSLANKYIHIDKKALSSRLRQRVSKFAVLDSGIGKYVLACPLIGQIGKNYSSGFDKLITGDELLKMACDKVGEAQLILSGRTVYLECEDKPCLNEFYKSNGFVCFGQRELDKDEVEITHGSYLLQYIRYLK